MKLEAISALSIGIPTSSWVNLSQNDILTGLPLASFIALPSASKRNPLFLKAFCMPLGVIPNPTENTEPPKPMIPSLQDCASLKAFTPPSVPAAIKSKGLYE